MTLIKPLHEVNGSLANVVMGREPADFLVTGVSLVNVCSGEIQPGCMIAVKHNRIAYAGPKGIRIDAEDVLNAQGLFATPGFIDLHVHFESTQVPPSEYAKAALFRGETVALPDCHEIANVLGTEGIMWMKENVERTPLKVVMGVPSCVPATPFETAGAAIDPEEVERLFSEERLPALAEMMNFPGVLACHEDPIQKIQSALRHGALVEGHISGQGWKELAAYFASGVMTCHESLTTEDLVNRARLGIMTYARAGSGWDEVNELAEALKVVPDHRLFCLVTDDRDPGDVFGMGTIDHAIRRAVEEGIPPVEAVQMATINPATHLTRIRVPGYGWVREVGRLAAGYRADIVLLSDLEEVRVDRVLVDGIPLSDYDFLGPDVSGITDTVHLARELGPEDFEISGDVHAIVMAEKFITNHEVIPLPDGFSFDSEKDLVILACVERHRGTGEISLCLLKGLGIKEGAVASTVAHDSHQMLVAGTNVGDMAFAASKIAESGGGIVAVRSGEVLSMIELPGAGLIGNATLEEMAEQSKSQKSAWRKLGCELHDPFMLFGLLGLTVIPHVRITPKGVFSVDQFQYLG